MADRTNEEIIRTFIEEGWNKGDAAVIERIIAPKAVGHVSHEPGPRTDVNRVTQVVKGIHAASKDFKVTIHEMVSSGDTVAVRWTARGTHTGELAGISPTNKSVSVVGSDFYHLKDGKIVEGWQVWDSLGAMTALGVMKAPWPATAPK